MLLSMLFAFVDLLDVCMFVGEISVQVFAHVLHWTVLTEL